MPARPETRHPSQGDASRRGNTHRTVTPATVTPAPGSPSTVSSSAPGASNPGSPAAASSAGAARTGRRAAGALIDISHRLRPRDYTIATLLDEHTTLTTDQITAVLFGSVTTCQHRLNALRGMRFVDRFLRNRPGQPNPACWVPGMLSARYAALARDEHPPNQRRLQDRQDRIYASPTLLHLLAVNDFFVALLSHARQHPAGRLRRWWSERSTAAAFGQRIHPDGHGVWTDGDAETGFFLELDRGTEPVGRLVEKLAAQRRLQEAGGPTYPVLFVLPTRAREQHLHRRLADQPEPALIVATTSPEAGRDPGRLRGLHGPAGPVWRVAGNGRHRLRLADLPSDHGEHSPMNPGAPQPDDDPLWLLDPT